MDAPSPSYDQPVGRPVSSNSPASLAELVRLLARQAACECHGRTTRALTTSPDNLGL